jgi:hypothetical protein
MEAIYSFKKIFNHFKPTNENFYRLAKISISLAKRYYKTKLYCDTQTFIEFKKNGLVFDEVVILKELEEYNGKLYCIPKINAMLNQTEPYVMLDFDSLIMEKLESTHTITYGYYEVDLINNISNNAHMSWINEGYLEPFSKIKDLYTQHELNMFDWRQFPNTSLIMVKNPYLVRTIFNKIFSRIEMPIVEETTTTLIEQFLLHQHVRMFGTDYGVFTDGPIDSTNNLMETMHTKKYLHLDINEDGFEDTLDMLEEFFKKYIIKPKNIIL